jgi:hypothetical protein
MEKHYFKFSTNWSNGKRLCGTCEKTYHEGNHILIETLKPYTSYVCPKSSQERGHSSVWTGASHEHPELRTPTEHLCQCGTEYVEEDKETWELSYELGSDWHPVSVVRSKWATHAQRDGLLELIQAGEPIRNVTLVQLEVKSS